MKAINEVQEKVIFDILKGFKRGRNQVLAWYTGSGKTNVFLEVVARILEKNPKARIGISAFLQKNIKDQTSDRAEYFLSEFHTMGRKVNLKESNVFIFNPQLLYFRNDSMQFDYLILDEAHYGIEGRYIDYLIETHCKPSVKLLACSATPYKVLRSERFQGADIYFRGTKEGLFEDGRLSDITIHIEKSEIVVSSDNYTRDFEVSSSFIRDNFEAFKESSLSKALSVISSKPTGNKCLIICPSGGDKEIARLIGSALEGALVLVEGDNEQVIIDTFKNNDFYQYLVVVNKCQIGFDFPDLTSVIDLTMTKNVDLLTQRFGRLSRKGRAEKNYYLVVDGDLNAEYAELVVNNAILSAMDLKYSMQEFKKREIPVFGGRSEISTQSMVDYFAAQELIPHKIMRMTQEILAANSWTLEKMVQECKKYKSRTELSVKNRYVYNEMLRFHKDTLLEVFPIKNVLGKWNDINVVEEAKKYRSKTHFRETARGAFDYIKRNKKMHLLEGLWK